MIRSALLILLLVAPMLTQEASAQDAPTLFQQLFPQPSGQNGYEEFVAAGELLSKSAVLAEGEQAGLNTLSLTKKRALLADPPVRDGLALFRRGLAKSLDAPRDRPDDSAFRAFAVYRRIARLLGVEEFVYCADGRVNRAIDSMEDGMRLGYALQRDSLIGGLVGIAVDAVAVQAMQARLEQWSAPDCKRIIRLAEAWQQAPDPAIEAMATERDLVLKQLDLQMPADPSFPREQVLAAMRARLDHYAENLSKPVWERTPPLPLQGNKLVADYVNSLGQTLDSSFEQAQNTFSRDRVKVQILGVHAAIRLHRWEHDALPSSLEPLNLGRMTRDIFTGKPLIYRTTGTATYELTSQGLKPPVN